MKQLSIKIKTVNAAFQDAPGCEYEAARILRCLADQVEAGGAGRAVIMDINGNVCGEIKTS